MAPPVLGMLGGMSFKPPSSIASGTPSPCVRNCTLNEQDVCLGCGRSLDDIKAWTQMSEPDKAACVARARQRLTDMGRPWPAGPLHMVGKGSQGHR